MNRQMSHENLCKEHKCVQKFAEDLRYASAADRRADPRSISSSSSGMDEGDEWEGWRAGVRKENSSERKFTKDRNSGGAA